MKGIRLVVVALAILGLSIAVIPPLSEVSQMGSTWRKDGKYYRQMKVALMLYSNR